MSQAQLDAEYAILKPLLWKKIGNAEASGEVWAATIEEAEEKHWLEGPYSWEELESKFGKDWVPVRRFGILQSGKLRVINDFSENATNSAYAAQEKLDLRTLDHIAWCAATLAKYFWHQRAVCIRLNDGSMLQGPVHRAWNDGALLSKTVDLKSAYKQLAIFPTERKRAVVAIKSPLDGQV